MFQELLGSVCSISVNKDIYKILLRNQEYLTFSTKNLSLAKLEKAIPNKR